MDSGRVAMNRILVAPVWFAMVWAPLALPTCGAVPQKAVSPAVIDINHASVEDFSRQSSVGPKLTHQIVAYRTQQGPFRRVEDLMIIKGMGSKKWKALLPFVCVGCVTERR